MKCPRCKKQLRKGAKFCTGCGASVEKKRGIRFTSILLVIVLLLSIVAIGLSGGILFAKYFDGNFQDLFSKKETIEIHNVEEAIAHAEEFGEEFGYENALSELTEKATTTIDGDSYYRLQQNYQGIPVYGRNIVYVTDTNGVATSVLGNAFDVDGLEKLAPSVPEHRILEAVTTYHKDMLGIDTCNIGVDDLNNAELYIYNLEEKESHLAYRICVDGYEYLIDAHNSEVLLVNSLIRFASITGNLSGQVETNGERKVYTDITYTEENDVYSLVDSSRNISAYTADNEYKWLQAKWVHKKDDLVSWNRSETVDPSAVDAFANVQITYDYFDQELQNKSIDGEGEKQIKVITGVLDLQDNACFSLGQEVINFGKANRYRYDKTAYIDWVAHEYMHGVEHNHSCMVYYGESGAVMEALSDIFGELVEAYANRNSVSDSYPNWIFTETGRNMINPVSNEFPERYNGAYWVNTDNPTEDNDWGGVHTNNTVISHAAYLMWHGGVLLDSDKRISESELAALWYRAMLMMPSDCNFVECRTLVELAASNMQLEDAQKQCVSESFDAVGIPRASEEEYLQLIHLLSTDGETAIKGTLYEKKSVDGVDTIVPAAKATLTVYSGDSKEVCKKVNLKNDDGKFDVKLPAGTYSVAITADGYIGQTISFELADNEVRYFSVELEPSDNKTGNKTDAYSAYLNATQKTIASGRWSEHLVMTANMAVTDGSAKTKTKVTLTSDADVSNYSESNPSQIRMSGSAEMTAMGQIYAWDMEYENGTAHYQYTKPEQSSSSLKMDPSFFNFGTITRDMISKEKISGNKIMFIVPSEKIAEVGIAAVKQMSGVDDLEYGDVDVTVTISDDGKIDNIIMVFHAALEYQGYDAEVDYNIDYRFSDNTNTTNKPASGGVPIVPGIYVQDGADYNILTVHETDRKTLKFSAFWYRIGDLSNVSAAVENNIASFEFFTPNAKMHVFGTLHSPSDSTIILKISESTHEYVGAGEYCYSLIGKIFSDEELKAISAALNVPADLDTEITQGEPGYWEGGGIYRTPIEIYYNGELIAGASVNSLTGELAGAIYTYSGHTEPTDAVQVAFQEDADRLQQYLDLSKSWGIRKDVSTEPNFPMEQIYDFAFIEDGTFYCYFYQQYTDFMYGFRGVYTFAEDQIRLYFKNDDGSSTLYAYYFDPDAMRMTQVSEKGIWNTEVGTAYNLINDEWLPSAQDVINSAKRAIDNKGVELGG